MRPILLVLLMITALGQVPGQPTVAPESGNSNSTSNPAAVRSPQLVYMKRLHALLKNTKHVPEGEKINVGGNLLATSIEATEIMGPGNTNDGLDMISGNTYTMQFSIPNQDEVKVIQSAELWLFPRQLSQSAENFVKMTLLVTVDIEHARQPRREVLSVNWNKATDCIVLNMTSLSKKVSRNLEKNNIKQANITMSIEVVSILSQKDISTNRYFTEMCNALAEKEAKTPFLVVKYFLQEGLDTPEDIRPKRSTTEEPETAKRSTTEKPETDSTPDPPPIARNCSIVPMVIDMIRLYGSFVLLPKTLDVKNCAGSCNQLHSPDKFHNHARMLDRSKLLTGRKLDRDVGCVPIRYKSTDLLITRSYQGSNQLLLTEFPDMIVTECACR